MSVYLVEAHAVFGDPSAPHLQTVQDRLRDHEDVLAQPPPQVLTSEGEERAVLQFTIEASNEVKADSLGEQVAKAALADDGSDGGRLAEIVLVSARTLGESEAPEGPDERPAGWTRDKTRRVGQPRL